MKAVRTLLMVLRTRCVEVSSDVEQQIRTCADTALLSQWLGRAGISIQLEDVLQADCAAAS